MEQTRFLELVRGLLILLFFYTAVSKLHNFEGFKLELGRQVFPAGWQTVLSIAIPASEIIVVLLLSFPFSRLYGFYGATFLMLVFTIYVFGALFKLYPHNPCACAGILQGMSWKTHAVFNLGFFMLALYGLVQIKRKKVQRQSDQ